MPHLPIDHPLRPAYRVAAALTGIYVLTFGITGVIQTAGTALFAQTGLHWVLGQRTNQAFAIVSVVAGAVIVVAAVVGRNIDVRVDIIGGTGFLALGTLMLALIPTDANFFGFSVANCIAGYLIGTLLLACGLYGRTRANNRPKLALSTQPTGLAT